MANISVSDIKQQMDSFSYEEKRTLAHALRLSLKHKPQKIHLKRGNGKEPVITNSLIGIFKDSTVTLEQVRDERLARQ